jgi:hypothetical protein
MELSLVDESHYSHDALSSVRIDCYVAQIAPIRM